MLERAGRSVQQQQARAVAGVLPEPGRVRSGGRSNWKLDNSNDASAQGVKAATFSMDEIR